MFVTVRSNSAATACNARARRVSFVSVSVLGRGKDFPRGDSLATHKQKLTSKSPPKIRCCPSLPLMKSWGFRENPTWYLQISSLVKQMGLNDSHPSIQLDRSPSARSPNSFRLSALSLMCDDCWASHSATSSLGVSGSCAITFTPSNFLNHSLQQQNIPICEHRNLRQENVC